jgi:propanediol dehydratase small subunit
MEAVMAGKVGMEDLRVTAEALELQAQVAENAGRPQLAENLRRAAELVAVPEETILEIYRALRPGRAGRQSLHAMADDLVARFGAKRCAALVREAAD